MNKKSNKSQHGPNERYAINFKLMIATGLVLLIASPAIYFWHGMSIARMSKTFLTQAESLILEANSFSDQDRELDADEALQKAIDYLWQYRRIHPEDPVSAVLLATTFERSQNGKLNRPRTAQLYLDAIARVTNQSGKNDDEEKQLVDLKIAAAEIMLEMNSFEDADEMMNSDEFSDEVLDNDNSLAATVLTIRAKAKWGRARQSLSPIEDPSQVGELLAYAIEKNPTNADLPTILASLYRDVENHQFLSSQQLEALGSTDLDAFQAKADKVIDDLVARNPNSALAYLTRYNYRRSIEPQVVPNDLDKAYSLDNKNPEINYQLGIRALENFKATNLGLNIDPESYSDQEKEQLDSALSHFNAAIEADSSMFSAHFAKGETLRFQGKRDQAIETWNSVLNSKQSTSFPTIYRAALQERVIGTLIEEGETEKAGKMLESMEGMIGTFARTTGDPRLLFELRQAKLYMDAVLKYKNSEYLAAITDLRKGLTNQGRRKEKRSFDFVRLLGAIFEEVGVVDEAAEVYQTAVGIDDSQVEFRTKLISARVRARQFNQAADVLSEIAVTTNAADDWLAFAEMAYRSEMKRQPASIRNWNRFRQAIEKVEQSPDQLKEPWRLDVLRMSAELAQNVDEESSIRGSQNSTEIVEVPSALKTRLQNLEDEAANNTELTKSLATIYQSMNQFDDAGRLLSQYAALAGNTAERYVFEANLRSAREQFEEASNALESGLQKVDESEKLSIELAVIGLSISQGEFSDAVSKLETLVEARPDRFDLVIRLAELVCQLPDQIKPDKNKWESRLAELEGEQGPYSSFIAIQRKLKQLENLDNLESKLQLLSECADDCTELIRAKTEWTIAYSLAGSIHHRKFDCLKAQDTEKIDRSRIRDSIESARNFYDRAIDLGERRSNFIYQMLNLEGQAEALIGQGRLGNNLNKKERLLSLLNSETIVSDRRLSNIKLAVLEGKNDFENARKAHETQTALKPDDANAWIYRARFELINGRFEDAKESLNKARGLASDSPSPKDAWSRIFMLYADAKGFLNSDEEASYWLGQAKEVMARVIQFTDGEERSLAQGNMFWRLGDHSAANYFLKAEAANPNDINTLTNVRVYFSSVNLPDINALDEAIRVARKLTTLAPTSESINRSYAELLVRRGKADDWQEAAKFLSKDDSVDNGRYYALLLLYKTNVGNAQRLENLQKAYSMVEAGTKVPDLLLSGQILHTWAKILDNNGSTDLAQEKTRLATKKFESAGDSTKATVNQVIVVTEFFIEVENFVKAEFYITKLENEQGQSAINRLPVITLTAKVMQGRNKPIREIVEYIASFEEKIIAESEVLPKAGRADVYQRLANAYELVDANEEALSWRRRAFAEDPSQRLRLALAQAENGETLEAIQLCIDGYQESGLPAYVMAITDILISKNCGPDHFEKAEPVFKAALRRFPKSPLLLMSIGNVRIGAQNKVADAIRLYEKARANDPSGNLLLLNNLATAYGEIPEKRTDAVVTIDRAIRLHGSRPELMDTKAVILMHQGQLKEAEIMLRDIINANSDPRYGWHLAEVKYKQFENSNDQKDLIEAKRQFGQSVENGLDQQVFTPSEKIRLSELRKQLQVVNPSSASIQVPTRPRQLTYKLNHILSYANAEYS